MHNQDQKTTADDRAEPIFSIRAVTGSNVSCAACDRRFTGSGPVGYRGDEPICDLCVLEGRTDLGMVLALISVARAYATISAKASKDWLDPLRELGAFARIYECFAAKAGPPRIFRIPGFTEGDAPGS